MCILHLIDLITTICHMVTVKSLIVACIYGSSAVNNYKQSSSINCQFKVIKLQRLSVDFKIAHHGLVV